jgi:DNA-binding transcriptional LysR family regulator
MAQPPLSVQIQDLEKDLGVKLFHRTGRGTTLTREGEVFLHEARAICEQVSRARRAVYQAASGQLGRLRVAGVPAAFIEDLPRVIPRFRRENPNIMLDLREGGTQQSLDSLLAGNLDVAFVREGDPVEGLEILPVRVGHFELIVTPGHPLAKRDVVDLEELAVEPFVVTSRNISPYYYDQTITALASAGVTPRTVIEASSIQAQIGYVACGMGVALVPTTGHLMHSHGVEWVSLRRAIASTEIAVAWVAGPIPEVVSIFLTLVREELLDKQEVASL